jgi:hypothetical protein
VSRPKTILTATYLKRLGEVEDFIFESSGKNISEVERFLEEHERVLEFIRDNPTTPAIHPQTGDQSWPFSDGRYRLFFKATASEVNLLDLIDNRMANIKVYTNNSLPTYFED